MIFGGPASAAGCDHLLGNTHGWQLLVSTWHHGIVCGRVAEQASQHVSGGPQAQNWPGTWHVHDACASQQHEIAPEALMQW